MIADRDELDEALQTGDISKEQYDAALIECDLIVAGLCSDISATIRQFDKIIYYVYDKINKGEEQLKEIL